MTWDDIVRMDREATVSHDGLDARGAMWFLYSGCRTLTDHLLTPQWQLAETRVFVYTRRRWWHRFIPIPNRSQEVTMKAFLERYAGK